ncbi:MAG: RsmB/NOP family class I SAM-dependent RNA methyltransferase [Pseudomonadota bacterium]
MTPAARVAAAISILDNILAGQSAEQALSAWGRKSRFAGAKDRAALRDLVFDALRKRASCAALGGGLHGRGLMLGCGIQENWDLEAVFSGQGHAPTSLTEAERALCANPSTLNGAIAVDLPDWTWTQFQADLSGRASAIAGTLRNRAALFLRVNSRKTLAAQAAEALLEDGVTAIPHPNVDGCLVVTDNPRRLQRARAYLEGWVEVQDAASQLAVSGLSIPKDATVLDYCAGGGGKALAIADRFDVRVTAHDSNTGRMHDIAARAARAGVAIDIVTPTDLKPDRRFDVVIVDAPCSGSGTWRRNPEAKWALTPEKLTSFQQLQSDILRKAAQFLTPGGRLVYMTCSIFNAENRDVANSFLEAAPKYMPTEKMDLYPSPDWDGFFCQSFVAPPTTLG